MEEVSKLLNSIDNLKHRVLLKTIYSAGLRVSEAIRLKPEHIESDPSRMVIRIEQGKGRKDRYTVLSRQLLGELRAYWQEYLPKCWLFPGQKPGTHITSASVSMILYDAKKKSAS
jgi:integrase/recombinase XerD